MIVISKKGIERRFEGELRVILELRGLSTEDKPVETCKNIYIDNGSVFIEIDTGNVYLYDMDSETWNLVSGTETHEEQEQTQEEQQEVGE